MQPSAQEKVLKTVPSFTSRGGKCNGAQGHCSIVRLAKRREGLGVQSLADLANLPLTGCRAFVLKDARAFTTNLKVVPC